MKPIYILTPHWIRTGGPEAQHQLSDALLTQGFDARLVYYVPSDLAGVGEENGQLVEWVGIPKEFPDYPAPSFEEYAGYRINPVRSIDCSKPCVVVLSETLAHLTPMFPPHVTVLLWWLSVDNAFGALAKVNLNYLRRQNVQHAVQSEYAGRVCDALGFVTIGMLSDYTTDLSHVWRWSWSTANTYRPRPKLIALNATHRKVIADLDAVVAAIHARDPSIECVKVQNMSRGDVLALFGRARVYVDLGNFPGKDRMPREAMLMGCAALALPVGAASETGAFICGGTDPASVADSVMMLMDSKPAQAVSTERGIFFGEVAAIFGLLGCEPNGEPYAL